MASSIYSTPFFSLILIISLLYFLSPSHAKTASHPHALLLTVQKDPSTLLYTTQLNQTTPRVSQSLTLDLGGQFLWVANCQKGYSSTTNRRSSRCRKNRRELFPENTVITAATTGELRSNGISILSTDGTNPGRVVSVPYFGLVCAPKFLLKGLPSGAKGMAGLGRTKTSLPSQFSSRFSFNNTFAICLPGVIFFGPGPYMLLQNHDVSTNLIYTPLLVNPMSTAAAYSEPEPSSDYFIGVTSIRINQKTVPNINASLLAIDSEGNGGTKISTVTPYTVLQTSIYNAVIEFYKSQLSEVPTVAAVAPFGLCFDSTGIGSTRVGPGVPEIDLMLQNAPVYWAIFGSNSMVQVSEDVMCLGFVDGGVNPRTSIVIGGYQLENNLLQFDLGASRLGFSSTLFSRQTTCANFNFTSNA